MGLARWSCQRGRSPADIAKSLPRTVHRAEGDLMARAAHGRQVTADGVLVRYAFGADADDPEAGILAIPVDSPADWYVEGREDRPKSAIAVARKASRTH